MSFTAERNRRTREASEVSVIIPAYNTAHLISACLASVTAQTYTEFEIIVVNDGSPDTEQLEKALEPYWEDIVYIRQENKRASGARNTAIRHAKGKYLAFLDSDDMWLPEHLANQLAMFDADPTLDLVYTDSLVAADAQWQWRFMERCPSEGEANFSSLVVERCQIPVSTVVARREAIVKTGLFDESLSCLDDYDMWVRTAFHGAKIGYSRMVQAHLAGRRPGSLSQSFSRMADAYCSILEKISRTLPLSSSQQALVRNRIVESRALFQLEEAKRELRQKKFGRARELFRQANRVLGRRDLDLIVATLGVAPAALLRVMSLRDELRSHLSQP